MHRGALRWQRRKIRRALRGGVEGHLLIGSKRWHQLLPFDIVANFCYNATMEAKWLTTEEAADYLGMGKTR